MAANRPRADELIEAATAFLENELSAHIEDAELAYKLRVCCYALKIVQRESRLGSSHAAQEKTALQAQLHNDEDDLEVLNTLLCNKIRNGDFDAEPSDLIRQLTELTMNKLAVDNPNYSTYKVLKTSST